MSGPDTGQVTTIPIASPRWRAALLLLFVIGFVVRLLAVVDMRGGPLGFIHESPGSEPWFHTTLAREIARGGSIWSPIQNIRLTPSMLDQAETAEWTALAGTRLPTGFPVVLILAAGFSLGQEMMLYHLAGAVAGGLLAVAVAMLGARAFVDRRAGVLAGLAAASHQALVTPAAIPGGGLFEALCIALFLLGVYLVREPGRAGWGWIAVGAALALGIWLRPFFLWGVLLVPVLLVTTPVRAPLGWLAGGVAVLAASVGLLSARNASVGAGPMPIVGNAAWEFARTTHPDAFLQEETPADLTLFRAAKGDFVETVRLTLALESTRQVLPQLVSHKLRRYLGARDVAGTYNHDYLRRRAEMLRLTTLASDTTMALFWGGLILLLSRSRAPRLLLAAVAALTLNALFGSTTGIERAMLHAIACVVAGGALIEAWDSRLRNPAAPLALIALWAGAHLVLQIDDQARGSRFRESDFVRSALHYRRQGDMQAFDRERDDFWNLRETEKVLREYWNSNR